MKITLNIEGDDQVVGEIAIPVAPGTVAAVQARAIDEGLDEALSEKARELGAVLDCAPSRFTRQVPGKDEEGRVRFSVRARMEGDRLVPAHPSNARKRR